MPIPLPGQPLVALVLDRAYRPPHNPLIPTIPFYLDLSHNRLRIVCGLAILLADTPCGAQEAQLSGSSTQVISARIESLKAADGSSTTGMEAAIDTWIEARAAANDTTIFTSQQTKYKTLTDSAPQDLVEINQRLGQPDPSTIPATTNYEEAVAGQNAAIAALKTARKGISVLLDQQRERRKRILEIPDQIEVSTTQLNELPAAIPQASATATELQKAQFERSVHRSQSLKEHLKSLTAEQDFYNATGELILARMNFANREIARLSIQEKEWRKRVNELRKQSAATTTEAARAQEQQFRSIATLHAYASSTVELAERRSGKSGTTSYLETASQARNSVETDFAKIHSDRRNNESRVRLLEAAGIRMLPKVGELLTREKRLLTEPSDLRDALRTGLHNSAVAEIELFELNERSLSESRTAESQVALFVTAANGTFSESDIRALVETRREILNTLIQDYNTYVSTLKETNELNRRSLEEAVEYHRFLDERLLWAPSSNKLKLQDLESEADDLVYFLRIHLHPWAKSLANHWAFFIVFAIACGFLLKNRRRIFHSLDTLADAAGRRNCTSFTPTARALGLSLIPAAPLSLLFGALGLLALDPVISVQLSYIAFFSGLVGFAIVASRPNGLLDVHFKMGKLRASRIHRQLKWFLPVMLPLVFLTGTLSANNAENGRVFFILMLIVIVILATKLLRPHHRLIHQNGKPSPLAKFWFAIGLLVPGSLIIGTYLGYFTSMLTLRILVVESLWLIILVWLITRLVNRWTLVSRRRLAIAQALRRREALLAEREKHFEKTNTDVGTRPQAIQSLEEVKAEAVNVVEVGEQTARLTRAIAISAMAFGLWAIWAPTLPALSVLDKVTIWSGSTSPTAPAASLANTTLPPDLRSANNIDFAQAESNGVSTSFLELIGPTTGAVSLQNILVGFAMLALTFVAARNVPGLLGLTLLRRIKLEPGGNFAFTTTVRYFILLVGIVLAFGKVGITWSNVQWIAAAVTVGIGFGLQEVFANFVAGLILLFERPIRLGDIVTIGSASGKVTQIRIRATTVLQFNNRELIVPNKELITGTLVNWTLTDGILRIEIPVGIAYGSDTQETKELLLQVAQDNPKVLKNPEPSVLFSSFGDSALSFQLRCHVGTVADMLPVKNDLFFAIEQAFRTAGIEIAFPQTDIHIRSIPDGLAMNLSDTKNPE